MQVNLERLCQRIMSLYSEVYVVAEIILKDKDTLETSFASLYTYSLRGVIRWVSLRASCVHEGAERKFLHGW